MRTFKKILLGLFLLLSTIGNAQILNNVQIGSVGEVFDRPTFISNTSAVTEGTSLTLTKPSGVSTNDLLIIAVGNDDTTGGPKWDNVTFKPSGFTFISASSTGALGCNHGLFYRIADGTETSTINVPHDGGTHDVAGFYIHIKGANITTPIGNLGTNYLANTGSSHTLVGTTGNIDDLGLYIIAGDGKNTNPMSVSGTGWVEQDEEEGGATAGEGVAVSFGIKEYDSTASTNAVITFNTSDGAAGIQIRIVK